jgi:protein-S-isoprenylcysteine O-methyltransferase Ste14
MFAGVSIISSLWMVFAVVWIFGWLRTKPTQERQPLQQRLLYGIPVFIGCYLMLSDRVSLGWWTSRALPRTAAIQATAILLTAAGIALAIWARFYIGQNWSGTVTIKVGHTLIRTGPYRWVRHPIYSGILLAMIGTALAHGKPISVLAIVLFWFGFRFKSRLEEQFMRKTFGQEYDEYARSTGALVPKL